MKVEKIRGFRDQYPEDMEPRKRILDIAEEQASRFGFRKIDVPSLESLDLYRIKSGDELVSQTYSFTDRGGREVTMIPEFTPSVVRMLTARKDIPRPVRWYGTPKLWRYEEPQAGRLREHVQFNADLFGPDSAGADAEVIGLAAAILDAVGLNGEYELRISSREVTERILAALGISDTGKAFQVIDRFRKVERDDFLLGLAGAGASPENAEKLLSIISEPFDISDLDEVLSRHLPDGSISSEVVERLMLTGRLVKTYTDSPVKYDISIVRGLSYYTGIVFEAFDTRGEFRSILGGGRYNNLAALLSDQDIPAVGFGMGDVVIELLARRAGKWYPADSGDSYYVASMVPESQAYVFSVANGIRRCRRAVLDVSSRSLSAQLKSAASSGCGFAVIIGKREASGESVTVRDMSSGEQKTMGRKEFLSSLE